MPNIHKEAKKAGIAHITPSGLAKKDILNTLSIYWKNCEIESIRKITQAIVTNTNTVSIENKRRMVNGCFSSNGCFAAFLPKSSAGINKMA